MTNHEFDPDAPEWQPVEKFFISVLHQDYDAVYGDAWEAVRDFTSGTSSNLLGPTARATRHLLKTFDDEELPDIVDRLGLAYYPPSDGYTYRQWLEEVATFLENKSAR